MQAERNKVYFKLLRRCFYYAKLIKKSEKIDFLREKYRFYVSFSIYFLANRNLLGQVVRSVLCEGKFYFE